MKFSVVIEKDEDGYYVASVPELPGCHTQSRTLDELMERIKEAVELYLEIEGPITEAKRELIGIQFIEVSASEPRPLPADKLIKVLVRVGFKPVRRKGSHFSVIKTSSDQPEEASACNKYCIHH